MRRLIRNGQNFTFYQNEQYTTRKNEQAAHSRQRFRTGSPVSSEDAGIVGNVRNKTKPIPSAHMEQIKQLELIHIVMN